MKNSMLNHPAPPEQKAVPSHPRPKHRLTSEIWKHRKEYLAISPFFIVFAIFGLFPIAFSMFLSFQKWDGIGEMTFNGLNNYQFMLTDPEFWKAVGNTLLIWVYSTIPMLFFALIIAFLLNAAFVRFRTFFESAIFFPMSPRSLPSPSSSERCSPTIMVCLTTCYPCLAFLPSSG